MATVFLPNQGEPATPVQSLQPVGCQADGTACNDNGDCYSGTRRPMAEGLACADK
jgi:hypothetical protein